MLLLGCRFPIITYFLVFATVTMLNALPILKSKLKRKTIAHEDNEGNVLGVAKIV